MESINDCNHQAPSLPSPPVVPLYLWPLIFEFVDWQTAKKLILLSHDVRNSLSQRQILTAQVKHLVHDREYQYVDDYDAEGEPLRKRESPLTVAAGCGRLDAVTMLVNDFGFGSREEDCEGTFPVVASVNNNEFTSLMWAPRS
ncbi:hypothetical protein HKX48_001652 [Thoreauomyces humboldtii]|nr:hypothetical protein HKX48_001652 [Thoreauomyces humboldtii]